MTQEEFIKYTEKMNKNIVSLLKGNEEELVFYSQLVKSFNRICDEKCKMEDKINKAIELLNNPWSFESGNKEVDEITYNKKRKVIDILKEVLK